MPIRRWAWHLSRGPQYNWCLSTPIVSCCDQKSRCKRCETWFNGLCFLGKKESVEGHVGDFWKRLNCVVTFSIFWSYAWLNQGAPINSRYFSVTRWNDLTRGLNVGEFTEANHQKYKKKTPFVLPLLLPPLLLVLGVCALWLLKLNTWMVLWLVFFFFCFGWNSKKNSFRLFLLWWHCQRRLVI